jgi:ATP-dependent Zn protease
MNLDESSKEEILKEVVYQSNKGNHSLSAADIHKALPQYSEEDLIALLNEDDFYEEICRRIYEKEKGAETNNIILWSEEERT